MGGFFRGLHVILPKPQKENPMPQFILTYHGGSQPVIPLELVVMDSAGQCNSCSSLRAGVRNPKVFRGRLFRWFATLSKSCCE